MCGIAGIYYQEQQVELAQLKKMTDIIAHRGPDGDGHWLSNDKRVGLGHRRLSIIDLSERGRQPMQYAQNRYTITFNGEIYNYLEIKEKLIQKGYRFQSDSDTEVLMALYADKGAACLDDLDGMFAFALYDEAEKTLFCARDRFGEKPFYYYYEPNRVFAFASEMKALWAVGFERKIKPKSLYNYLLNNYVSDPTDNSSTFFEGCIKLEAAHYLLINNDLSVQKKQYWRIDKENLGQSSLSFEAATEQLNELFTLSVKRRLRSDVPVGSSLSGGLDSSAVVCCINKLNTDKSIKQKTFSARFRNFVKDEGEFMQYVIDNTAAEPHFVYPDDEKMVQEWEKLMFHQEEPVGSSSIYAQWNVMWLAQENGVIVLLDGQGADELLAGYHPYYKNFWRELEKTNPALFHAEQQAHNDLFFVAPKPKTFWQRYTYGYVDYRIRTLLGIYSEPKPNPPFLNPDFAAQFDEKDSINLETIYQSTFADLNKALHFSTFDYGLEDLLRFADRNSMAFSREVRLPFLFHEIAELLFSLPSHYKIRQGWTKYIQRKAFENMLPPQITWRKDKIGYEPPQKTWFEKQPLKSILHEYKTKLEREKIINPKHKIEEADQWRIFMLGTFLNK